MKIRKSYIPSRRITFLKKYIKKYKITESDDESKETIYRIAVGKYESDDISVLTEAVVLLARVIGYKDSAKKIDLFRKKSLWFQKKKQKESSTEHRKSVSTVAEISKDFLNKSVKTVVWSRIINLRLVVDCYFNSLMIRKIQVNPKSK